MYTGRGYTVLTRKWADLNCDGCPETVTVTGKVQSEGGFAQSMMLLIRDGASGETVRSQIPNGEGYAPSLAFSNVTGSGCDILLVIPTGGSGGTINADVWRPTEGVPRLLFDSETYNETFQYRVTYQDGYKVLVESFFNGAQYWIDLSGRDADYLSQAYDAGGRLLKPVEGWVDPLGGLNPVDFDGDGIYDLMAWQQIAGLYHADSLGFIQNILHFENHQFVLERQYLALVGLVAE